MMNNEVGEGSFHERSLDFETVTKWSSAEVGSWLRFKGHAEDYIETLCAQQRVDGKSLLLLTESDLRQPPIRITVNYNEAKTYVSASTIDHYSSTLCLI